MFAPFKSLKVKGTENLEYEIYPFTVILAYIHYKPIIKKHLTYLNEGGNFIILWPSFNIINKDNYMEF